jgi:hypothetical protein
MSEKLEQDLFGRISSLKIEHATKTFMFCL